MKTIVEYLINNHVQNANYFNNDLKSLEDVDNAMFALCEKYRNSTPKIELFFVAHDNELKYIESSTKQKNTSKRVNYNEFRKNLLKNKPFIFFLSYYINDNFNGICNNTLLNLIKKKLLENNINICTYDSTTEFRIDNNAKAHYVLLNNLYEFDIVLSIIKSLL